MDDENKQRFYLALASVPAGKVTTYGHLAAQAGKPTGARWAAFMLKHLPEGSSLPWHRVINAQGRISFPQDSEQYELQKGLLLEEGIEFSAAGKINLKHYLL